MPDRTPAETLSLEGLKVTPLSDGHLDIPAAYFSNLGPEELERVTPAARFGANTWLIETATRKILVDAGSGLWLRERFPASGALDWQDTAKTAERAAITDIVVTHMHADHIGGLSRAGKSLFPNAEIHIQAAEWDYWTDAALPEAVPEDRRPLIRLIQSLAEPLAAQLKLHEGEADLGNGITLLPAPGHTPGHQVVHLGSGREEILLIADTIVSGALQFDNPGVTYALDSDPALAVETRRQLFDRISADQLPFAVTHLTDKGFGYLQRRGSGYARTPLA
jgi:glyoxylase-like metal-dependent hydrolase (beta-lactamase superfamily II)